MTLKPGLANAMPSPPLNSGIEMYFSLRIEISASCTSEVQRVSSSKRPISPFLIAVIAVIDCERHEDAAGMIDVDEGGLRDHAERALGTIVGMGAPADIGEEAGGMTQPTLAFRFRKTLMGE